MSGPPVTDGFPVVATLAARLTKLEVRSIRDAAGAAHEAAGLAQRLRRMPNQMERATPAIMTVFFRLAETGAKNGDSILCLDAWDCMNVLALRLRGGARLQAIDEALFHYKRFVDTGDNLDQKSIAIHKAIALVEGLESSPKLQLQTAIKLYNLFPPWSPVAMEMACRQEREIEIFHLDYFIDALALAVRPIMAVRNPSTQEYRFESPDEMWVRRTREVFERVDGIENFSTDASIPEAPDYALPFRHALARVANQL